MGTTNFDKVQAGTYYDSSGNIIGGDDLKLAEGKIFVGQADGLTDEKDLSGDATLAATGALTIGAKKVGAAKIALTEGSLLRGAAGGAAEELAKGSADQILAMDGGGGFPGYVTVSGDLSHSAGTFTIAGSIVRIAQFNINAAGIKGMAAAPVSIIAAPGAGKGIVFEGATLKLVAGSEVLSEAADNLVFKYTDGSGVAVSEVIETPGFIDQAANTVTNAVPVKDAIVAQTGMENQALVLWNNNAEIAGNISNDAELRVTVKYRTIVL